MDLFDFLKQFVAGDVTHVIVVAGLVGAFVYAFIQALDRIAQNRPPGGVGLNPNWKFWIALGGSLALPFTAYFLVINNEQQPVTLSGVALAGGVAFMAATLLHWVTGGSARAVESHNLEKVAAANERFDRVTMAPPPDNDTGL